MSCPHRDGRWQDRVMTREMREEGGGGERERSNSKTLFYKRCSFGSVITCVATSPC